MFGVSMAEGVGERKVLYSQVLDSGGEHILFTARIVRIFTSTNALDTLWEDQQ